MSNKRQKAYRKGLYAEWFAAILFVFMGYRLVARRYKTPLGEVDLIVRKRNLIVFVEVKARASEEAALNSISHNAQRRIEAAANLWLSGQRDAGQLNWRFDVVAVLPRKWPRHYVDVW